MIWIKRSYRIQEAIENGELIHIYGDYDADGITSTTILYETLEMLGAPRIVLFTESLYRWLWSQYSSVPTRD